MEKLGKHEINPRRSPSTNRRTSLMTTKEHNLVDPNSGPTEIDPWEPRDYILATIARIYVANAQAKPRIVELGPFPQDLPNENIFRVWNVIAFLNKSKYLLPE